MPKSYPKAAVILLNWNGWHDTLDCMASLERLDYPNREVLVVDNGSTDGSVERIRAAYPGVALVETGANLGYAGGNNAGIRLAVQRGADYVWVLNNDTLPDPCALQAMVALAEADPRVGVVGSVLYYADEPGRVQAYGGGRVDMTLGIARYLKGKEELGRLDYVTGASLLIRREALQRVGLLDDRFFMCWEDADYGFRARQAGYRLAVAAGSRVLHKESASLGKASRAMVVNYNASAFRFFGKHAARPWLPIALGVGGRLAKLLARGQPGAVSAVAEGCRLGLEISR